MKGFVNTRGATSGELQAVRVIAEAAQEAADQAINRYGTCTTAAATAAKVVTLAGFALYTGAVIAVKFTYTNTADSPTLNVNGTGAKAIKKYGATAPSTYMWMVGAVVTFVYDGTYWIMVNGTTATTTYYGLTKLSSSVSDTSTTTAATPSAVKQAYDMATVAQEAITEATNKTADVVVEQGVSGAWTYRKWNSGMAECFANYSISTRFTTAYAGGYIASTGGRVSFPTGLFIDIPKFYVTPVESENDDVYDIVAPDLIGVAVRPSIASATKDYTPAFYLIAATSTSYTTGLVTCRVGVYAVGNWQ